MLKVRHFENLQGCSVPYRLGTWRFYGVSCAFDPNDLSYQLWSDETLFFSATRVLFSPLNSFSLLSPQFSKHLGGYERFTRKKEPCDPQLVLLHVDVCICDLLQLLFCHDSARLAEKGIAVVIYWPLNGTGGNMYLILIAHRLVIICSIFQDVALNPAKCAVVN